MWQYSEKSPHRNRAPGEGMSKSTYSCVICWLAIGLTLHWFNWKFVLCMLLFNTASILYLEALREESIARLEGEGM